MIIEFILLFINFQHYVGFKYFKKKNLESPPPYNHKWIRSKFGG